MSAMPGGVRGTQNSTHMTLLRPRFFRKGKCSLRGNEDRYRSVETVAKFSGARSVPSSTSGTGAIGDVFVVAVVSRLR